VTKVGIIGNGAVGHAVAYQVQKQGFGVVLIDKTGPVAAQATISWDRDEDLKLAANNDPMDLETLLSH